MHSNPILIERQGSFYAGGREVKAAGTFDATASRKPGSDGQTFWIDQMYVQFQIPPNARKYPLVLIHGGGGTGRVWESTPDGREGYQTLFLRRGFSVYIVDLPRGGRSGFPSFNAELGRLDDQQSIVRDVTSRPGREKIWSRWRIGPCYPQVFPTQAFPVGDIEQFLRHIRPMVSDDPEVACAALLELLDWIGPAVLVTHSNGGLPGWLAAARSNLVKGIVSYEPGFVFPEDELPSPVPLYKGAQPSGTPIPSEQFGRLAEVPLQVVYGDNIPTSPVPDLIADDRRAQVVTCNKFVDALNLRGGRASSLHLRDAGLLGNSHFMFSDLNNVKVADELSTFLETHRLDVRDSA